ncbi:MAG: NAD(P)H-binding protein [Bifidobacterium aquikefiri]|uniref:Oxidoreductase n=1 Tax=Bifidobacterium aquikefiri TaxID=1653207 RepID=A0A261G151_9BIFI|nr:NAD(P)H-binding protein [Bifidobacterium aquikefiri]OZG65164.1 oxidoreductase [Bifidobacterium aquikefiri]
MKLAILGAHGRIARIVEERILNEDRFQDIELTLLLKRSSRLNDMKDNPRVTLIEGDLENKKAANAALAGQDMVFLATVDTSPTNVITKNVIDAMHAQGVHRLLAASSIGIYQEEPNQKFREWNQRTLKDYLPPIRIEDEMLRKSDIDFTTLRFAWLNDRDEIAYQITKKGELFVGGSGSRKSMADAILKIVETPTLYERETIGIADPSTKDAPTVVR